VQDALVVAARRLPEYLANRPVPFFVWLRQIGLDRLNDHCRRHLYAESRSVFREEDVGLSDDSISLLAGQFAASSSGPEGKLAREETRQRMRKCLEQMDPSDRDLLLMRYAEQLQIIELAAALQITEGAAKSRVRRAPEKLQQLLADESI
jgi:RNA polymerase sigma-70 factor (ECF subfamily)